MPMVAPDKRLRGSQMEGNQLHRPAC
jgi:hypothetical protein